MYRFLLVWLVVALGGCAGLSPRTNTRILKDKAAQYWRFRADRNFKGSYSLECPSVRREYSFEQYVRSFGGVLRYKEVSPVNVKIDGNQATVYLRARIKFVLAPSEKVTEIMIKDHWRMEEGGWCHVWKPWSLLRPPKR